MSFPATRTRRSPTDNLGMDQPDDSPSHSLRGMRATSMPLVPQLNDSHPPTTQQQQQQTPSTAVPPYLSQQRRRSSPLAQHVPPPVSASQTYQPTGHPQFHSPSHMEQAPEPQGQPTTTSTSTTTTTTTNGQVQRTPPLTYPRTVQRVPPPPLHLPETRYTAIREDWARTDQLLAEMERATTEGAGQTQSPTASMPKGPVIERERKRDSSRDADVGGSGGSAGSGMHRTGSLRRNVSTQQSPSGKSDTPPRTPPHTQTMAGQAQRPLPSVPDKSGTRGSPTYYAPAGSDAAAASPYGQPSPPAYARDQSPPFRYDERNQPSKTRTPDRSLPVQEENEAEEDERAREKEKRELDMETLKPAARVGANVNPRLPTPQFSHSPMFLPERMQQNDPGTEELSSTVQGDDYHDDDHHYEDENDGRSSRAGHYDEEEEGQVHREDRDEDEHLHAVHHEGEEQDDSESGTPRSPQPPLPPPMGQAGQQPQPQHQTSTTTHIPYTNHHHLQYNYPHFRPRTASSDVVAMASLDAAMLYDAIERLQHPDAAAAGQQQQHQGMGNYSQHEPSTQHPPRNHTRQTDASAAANAHTRVPNADDIRAMANDAYHRQTSRPGAPVPPTPPNSSTYAGLAYMPTAMSPPLATLSPPPRATPYPFSYAAHHYLMQQQQQHQLHQHQRSPDPQEMLHHLQQQQLQNLQMLGVQTDSTFSPSSTPYPTYDYSPFLPEHFRRRVDDPTMSMRSSPSHLPLALPFFQPDPRRVAMRRRSVRRMRGTRELAKTLPPRGESTEPLETEASPSSSPGPSEDEEDEDEDEVDRIYEMVVKGGEGVSSDNVSTAKEKKSSSSSSAGTKENGRAAVVDEEGEWVDEEEDDEDDFLHLEYHPAYVVNPDKRRKRWDAKWDALVKAFQALDKQTDASLLLLAAPQHSKRMHIVRSRAFRRSSGLAKSPELSHIKSNFRRLATQRQATRGHGRSASLYDRLDQYYAAPTAAESLEGREDDMKRDLGAALSSLRILSNVYQSREERWRMEMAMMREENERVNVLLRQAFGEGLETDWPHEGMNHM